MAAGGSNEPNLTPFIDLFSVLICFLLMTAAWVQLESVTVQVEKVPAPNEAAADPTLPPDKPPEKKTKLTVFMYPERVVLLEDENEYAIPNQNSIWDKSAIQKKLGEWRVKFPAKKDIILSTEARVTYGQLIKMYDFLVQADWPEVGINPN